ncbi:hypothetical protein XM38_000540 [Halomicronema hongdechloris C2206]|uniref:DUF2993 domain-containing protein n=2 Tax=Halomicronema hongdechloris TaxID=1209493 RepID=A0A1Z3HFS4_9CYAN|nr:hypothetical protein XM38_000540 [Halomicronema hongdechloris C2206]
MLGGLMGTQTAVGADFGERMLNSVASQSIRHLFSRSELVEVDIRCSPPSKLLQGVVDSFKMNGRGLVIRQQFEAQEMMFETDAVSIDVGALFGGKLRLRQPTQAVAQVILAEDAINRAFEADLVKARLQQVDHPELTQLSGGEPVSFRNVKVQLHPNQRIAIAAYTDLPNIQNVPLQVMTTLTLEKRRRIRFADPEFQPEGIPEDMQGVSEVLTEGLVKVLDNMVDLDRFNLDGVLLRVNRLETKGKQLVFSGYAQIEHFPRI